jgi:hypothetical protein
MGAFLSLIPIQAYSNAFERVTLEGFSIGMADVAVPVGIAYQGGDGNIYSTKDKYTQNFDTFNLHGTLNIFKANKITLDMLLKLSTGYSSYALGVAPYLRPELKLSIEFGANTLLTFKHSMSPVGGVIKEIAGVDQSNPRLGYWSFATAGPWSDYGGVHFSKYKSIQILHSF